jgi:hypothetical protein
MDMKVVVEKLQVLIVVPIPCKDSWSEAAGHI